MWQSEIIYLHADEDADTGTDNKQDNDEDNRTMKRHAEPVLAGIVHESVIETQ